MTPAQFAEFFRRQGHRVFEGSAVFWYDAYPFSFMSLPYHQHVQPSSPELSHLFWEKFAAVVRFPMDPLPGQAEEGLFICDRRDYGLATVQQKARNQIRRGLELCTVRQVELSYAQKDCFPLVEETLARQGRNLKAMSQRKWERYCGAASAIPGFESWVAFIGGRPAALAVTGVVQDCYNILYQASSTEFLSSYPNNAIIFEITRQALEKPEISFVSYGMKSLDDAAGLHHFKKSMGYELQPFADTVLLHPALRILARLGGRRVVSSLASHMPGSDFWRKASRVFEAERAGESNKGTLRQSGNCRSVIDPSWIEKNRPDQEPTKDKPLASKVAKP